MMGGEIIKMVMLSDLIIILILLIIAISIIMSKLYIKHKVLKK